MIARSACWMLPKGLPWRKSALAPLGVIASPAAFAWAQVTPIFLEGTGNDWQP